MIQIFNKDVLKVLTIFSTSPGSKFLRNELKEITRLNNVVLDNVLTLLINSKIIEKQKRLLVLKYNEKARKLIKIIFEEYKSLKEIPFEVYFSLIELINFLSKFKGVKVYLFGSYSKLIYKRDSDIDIAIISEKINKSDINKLVNKIEKVYGKKIELHFFGKNFYKNKKDPLVKDILKNGVELI